MMRDARATAAYWNKWVSFSEGAIQKAKKIRESGPPGDPNYEPQYVFEIAQRYLRLMLQRYSRGDEVSELAQYFPGLLDAWEESERLGKEVWSDQVQYTRHAWTVNLDHYINCFWRTGLALTLNIPDDQWQRLLALMGNEGEDALLDQVIASRQLGRKIGNKLCFPKAYQKLLAVVEAPVEQRSQLLRAYLDDWFPSLDNAGHPSFPRDHRTPSWYTYGDINFEGGAYFGRWCIEAVAVAKAFDIDDSLCLDHPHYPGDLLRDGRSPRYPGKASDTEPASPSSARSHSWFARLFGKR